MYQLIKHVLSNPDDKTKLSLLFANQVLLAKLKYIKLRVLVCSSGFQTEDDILLREEFDTLAEQHPERFKIWYTVDRAKSGNVKSLVDSSDFIT